jgi:hypothetical protein
VNAYTAESVARLHHTWSLYRQGRETLAALRIDADQALLDMFEVLP